ncbi:hypothetical protein [Planctomyces sp. SH-PL62]|uniref:hypothetical protein n=1 Tax=Planctomyces sp. SH-PL62 TaxID=1636152 RepID=UPI00078E56AD|nr:hypothetical protein [Planctomyces sp. SH-PL62]AMV37564.1 hypothetical protein VT85_09015 [Planctomyces sp. SH-PL62]
MKNSATPHEPDWAIASTKLVLACDEAIGRFAREHPDACCSFLALAVGSCFGEVVIAFDTLANGLARAKRHESLVVRTRNRTLATEFGWRNVGFHLNRSLIVSHAPSAAEFAYPDFARMHFADWEPYFLDRDRPAEDDPTGKVAVLLQGVANSIVDRGLLRRLNLASPFYVGAEFAREDLGLVVLRATNWPS